MRDDSGVSSQWRGENCVNTVCNFKAELIGFADVLDMGDERKKRVKHDFKIFDLRVRWNCHQLIRERF